MSFTTTTPCKPHSPLPRRTYILQVSLKVSLFSDAFPDCSAQVRSPVLCYGSPCFLFIALTTDAIK